MAHAIAPCIIILVISFSGATSLRTRYQPHWRRHQSIVKSKLFRSNFHLRLATDFTALNTRTIPAAIVSRAGFGGKSNQQNSRSGRREQRATEGEEDGTSSSLSKRERRRERNREWRAERQREREVWRTRIEGKYLATFPRDRELCIIVDGNNVMGISPEKGLSKNELLKKMTRFVNGDLLMSRADVILVFDSRGPKSIERNGRMEVLFCGKGVLADDVIVDCVEDELELHCSHLVVVVTSDVELGFRSVQKGAHYIMKSDSFYKLMDAPENTCPPSSPNLPGGHV
mmetsp:Transcript_13632/g.22291  ORF Transcript_13632/g.22291 Transcript_13632/m.22291 type:complete len:286 (-) Transcript_13632:69-926(-)